MGWAPAAGGARGAAGSVAGRRPAAGRGLGLRVLIPGYAQWTWRQPERALVFFGSFAAAASVSVFAWGTRTGAAVLAFAFLMHVAATADVIRQAAFPGFGRWVPTVSASVGLGLGCYGPAVALATMIAWPGLRVGAPQEGYLVNRWAYQADDPHPGDWVWFEAPEEGRGHGVTQVLAAARQGVEWSDGQLWVGGQPVAWLPPKAAAMPDHLALVVPDDHVLVASTGGLVGEGSCGLALLPRHNVLGRAWARMYPVRGRQLLD